MNRTTMTSLADQIPDEASAYEFLERMRWNGTAVCPHCNGTDCGYLRPDNGTSRKTRTGAMSARRVWKCRDCRKQFSVLTGTVMHGTKISVRIWIFAIFEMVSNKNGNAAAELSRRYGVSLRTAWHLTHRLREAMGNDGPAAMMRGTVVADETYIGGDITRMNRATRARMNRPERPAPDPTDRRSQNAGPGFNKVSVLSLIDEGTGEVRSKIVADVTGATLRKAIAEQVDMAGTILYTDESQSYKALGREFLAHETVNHREGQYARYVGGKVITSNAAENFFSQLKRSLDGTHHHVSRKHLARYLAEFDFRHSTRDMTDTDRMALLIQRTEGVRLSYRPLTAA